VEIDAGQIEARLIAAASQDPATWSSLLPADTIKSQNLNRLYVQAGEALVFGATVNLYDKGAGVLGARKADATNATVKPCHGFVNTVHATALGDFCEVIVTQGMCTAIAGLTVGTTYYQSTTPGLITSVKPIAPNMIQPVGFALGTAMMYFNSPLVP